MRSPAATFDLRAALSEEIHAALKALELQTPPPPKAVHRCRVHLKRARALARVGAVAAPGLSEVFNDTARSVMRSLAHARDLAALAASARVIAEKAPRKQSDALEIVADELDTQRAALPPLNVDAVRAGLRDLNALALVWPEASPRQIAKGAERIAERAAAACAHGKGETDPTLRHEWRKREKDRFYAVSLMDKAWPRKRRRRRELGEKLGEALGRERDALLLMDKIKADPAIAGSRDNAKRALKALEARRSRVARRADKIGVRLHRGGA